MSRARGGRVGQIDAGRKLDVEIAGRVYADVRGLEPAVQHVPAAQPVLTDEVQVPAAHLDPLGEGGKSKADDRAVRVRELEDSLVRDDLGQRPVRRLLP